MNTLHFTKQVIGRSPTGDNDAMKQTKELWTPSAVLDVIPFANVVNVFLESGLNNKILAFLRVPQLQSIKLRGLVFFFNKIIINSVLEETFFQ